MTEPLDRHAINLRWLVRLRWGAAAGQGTVILLVDRLMGIGLPLAPLFAVVAIAAASNVALSAWARRLGRVPEWSLGAILAFDVLLLTALLYLSGGSFNPFNFLYLVHIALAAVVLRPAHVWGLTVLSLGCFATLFVPGSTLSEHQLLDHAHQMEIHLRGMWVAFAVAAVFIVYFVQRIRSALAERDAELLVAHERTVRGERLASLATLAAGAAHELSTPLATIAVAAGEIDSALARDDRAALVADAELIRAQVRRCRAILDQMSHEAGSTPGEAPERVALGELAKLAAGEVESERRIDVAIEDAYAVLEVPRGVTVRALRGLIDNACDATPAGSTVEVRAHQNGREAILEVRDRGTGMSPAILARAGEPFFTTKEPGRGMGLGLFLANALAERLGGRLEIDSAEGRGTTVRLVLPAATNDRIAGRAEVAEA